MHRIDGAGNVSGQFVAEDPATSTPGTTITEDWLNAVQAEICNFILLSGFSLDKQNNNQLFEAFSKMTSRVGEIVFLPTLTSPEAAIKANGALLSRSSYAKLWDFAQASGLVDSSDEQWSTKKNTNGTCGLFSPGNGSTTFRIPDLRGDFIRIAADGNSVDSGRSAGTFQSDDNKSHIHTYQRATDQGNGTASGIVADNNLYVQQQLNFSSFVNASGGAEARPRNTAYIAYIFYR